MNNFIHKFVNKLIDNLPEKLKNVDNPIVLDLVLGGGAFNGSYQIGALYFLKEMEKRGYIIIKRVSGCSIGSIMGLFYLIDKLENIGFFYKKVVNHFKKYHNLAIVKDISLLFNDIIPANVCDIINDKLYICYNNIKTREKSIKKHYKNVDEIYNTIIKSSFLPYITDGYLTYKNKYIDGVNPYVFNTKKDRKILFLDLYSFDKVHLAFNVKNEQSNINRILIGLLEINMFFIKQQSTQMCSYKNNWNICELTYNSAKYIIEKIIIYILSLLFFIKKLNPFYIQQNNMYKVVINLLKKIKTKCLYTYCL